MISASEIKDFCSYKLGEIKDAWNDAKSFTDGIVDISGAFSLDKIIEVVIALIVIATVLPIGLKEFMKAGNTAILSEGSVHAVWVIAPVIIVLGLVLGLVYMALGRTR
jgi:hypothetical protein